MMHQQVLPDVILTARKQFEGLSVQVSGFRLIVQDLTPERCTLKPLTSFMVLCHLHFSAK
jgi:hypothetical protein